MPESGHLFVVQADLTRLAADAFLIPCDDKVRVSGTWRPFLQPGIPIQPKERWFTAEGVKLRKGLAVLDDPTPERATSPDHVVGLRVLVDTVGVRSIKAMVKRALAAVQLAARAAPHGGRVLPLVAMPILGVGQGKFPGRRAEVVRELIQQLLQFVSANPVDVVLTLRRTSDFAAAEWERNRAQNLGAEFWPELTTAQLQLADRLGRLAADGQLSIFAGAGVSRPVGLPSWQDLLQDLAETELTFTQETNYPQMAQDLNIEGLNSRVADKLMTSKHSLGHALLVDMRTPSLVTTNYDPCLENAAEAVLTKQPLRVLARQLAVGGNPWLLKLHGDVAAPDTIVLTKDQYEMLSRDWGALRGVVQTLMLTSHLLFVGFGFADDDFLAMSQAVQRVRQLAEDPLATAKVGTAIALCQSDKRKYEELDYHHMRVDNDTERAARQLEIFLDRVAWRCQVAGPGRACYLLDADYQKDANGPDRVLAKALTGLYQNEKDWHDSSGAQALRDLMDDLGWSPPVY